MKMAKRQSLSLNPAKISGQCGRLMCCLSYENDQYHDPKKKKAAAEPEETEREGSGTDWTAILEDEAAAPAEEESHEFEAEMEDTGPGEAVLVVNPDGTEEVFEDEEEPQGTPDGESAENAPSQRSRRRRRRRKPRSNGGNATPNPQ